MAIVRWEPARELASMEIDRLNRMFSDFYGEAFSRSAWVPAVDIYETENHEVVLKAELPEVKREDISVTFRERRADRSRVSASSSRRPSRRTTTASSGGTEPSRGRSRCRTPSTRRASARRTRTAC